MYCLEKVLPRHNFFLSSNASLNYRQEHCFGCTSVYLEDQSVVNPILFFLLGKPSGSVGHWIVPIKLTENRLRWEVSVFSGFSNPPSVSL